MCNRAPLPYDRAMARLAITVMGPLAALLLTGCPEPDSVELGGDCKEQVECKAPADKCVSALGRQQCTTTCTAENVCPEGFVCARMDITVTEPGVGGEKWTGEGGYCLRESDVPKRAAKIRPKKGKGKKKRKKGG